MKSSRIVKGAMVRLLYIVFWEYFRYTFYRKNNVAFGGRADVFCTGWNAGMRII